jgi:hypothetical protein
VRITDSLIDSMSNFFDAGKIKLLSLWQNVYMACPSSSSFGAFFLLSYNVSHWLLALVFLVERHYQGDLVGGVVFLVPLFLKIPGSWFGYKSDSWSDFAVSFIILGGLRVAAYDFGLLQALVRVVRGLCNNSKYFGPLGIGLVVVFCEHPSTPESLIRAVPFCWVASMIMFGGDKVGLVAFWLLHLVALFASQRGAGEPRWLVAVAVGFLIAFNVRYSAPGAANAAAAAAAGGGEGPGAAVAAAPPLDNAYEKVELGGQGGGENPADAAGAAAGGRETPPRASSRSDYSPPSTRAPYRTKSTE